MANRDKSCYYGGCCVCCEFFYEAATYMLLLISLVYRAVAGCYVSEEDSWWWTFDRVEWCWNILVVVSVFCSSFASFAWWCFPRICFKFKEGYYFFYSLFCILLTFVSWVIMTDWRSLKLSFFLNGRMQQWLWTPCYLLRFVSFWMCLWSSRRETER